MLRVMNEVRVGICLVVGLSTGSLPSSNVCWRDQSPRGREVEEAYWV